MSEVVEPVTPTILPAKSEDKLEIEKEEIEKEEEKKEEGAEDTKVEKEEVKDDKEKTEESIEKKNEGEVEKTEDEAEEGEDNKKFKMPKIKTPKVIKELRSKSKERKKKKEEEKQNEEEKPNEDKDAKKEDDEGDEKKAGEEEAEGEGKKEGEEVTEMEERKDETKDTKTKIKDAIDNIHIPKLHKPSFMKKKEEPENKAEGNLEDESDDKKEEGEKEDKEGKDEKSDEKEEKEKTDESKESMEVKPEGTKDAKTKVKKALDNIHMPKMPKFHKPNFMKKKPEEATISEEKETTAEEPEKDIGKEETGKADTEETKEDEKETATHEVEEKLEKTDEEETKPDKKSLMSLMTAKISKPDLLNKEKVSEEEKEAKESDDTKPDDAKSEQEEEKAEKENITNEKDGEKNEEEKVDITEKSDEKDEKEEDAKKSTIMDSLRSIKAPKLFSNKKEKTTDQDTDESQELLERREDEEDTVEDGKDLATAENEKTETPSKASTLLQNIRSVASGVPALFKNGKYNEVDVEAGESQELLEKKDTTDTQDSNKIDEEELIEIKLDDGTEKKDPDSKSQGSEKKDAEKSDEEKDSSSTVKKAPSEACAWFQALDPQKKFGICGIILGIILIILIIIIAASVTPGNWYNANRMVQGGKYIETITSCGTIQGLVDGEDRYSFTGIPYSVPVTGDRRFTHSRLPATLSECPNGTFLAHAGNATKPTGSCWRMLPGGITGDEHCLTLDIFTSNVVYNELLPVVVYVAGEGLDIEEEHALRPTSALAQQKMTVFVTVSIRTGVLGFLSHPALARDEYHHSSGNYGLRDLVTALEWIKVNIQHFGGHPSKVTLLGHQFGATVVTSLMGTPVADGLFSKIWVTSGAGKFSNKTEEEVQADSEKVLETLNCGEDKRSCLMEASPKELLEAVPEAFNTATKMDLPSDSEEPQHSWLAKDNFLFTRIPFSTEKRIALPIVIGAPAQTDATSDGFQYMPNWNNTDKYENMVESSLASFGDNTFPRTAMDQYNMSNNWKEYTSMVSDIRTICPLELMAHEAAKHNDDSVFFYVAETSRSASQLGGVADATTDIAAIFGLFEPENFHEEKFVENMQSMFYSFVKRGTLPGNTLIGDGIYQVCHKISYNKAYKTCKFWKDTEWNIVPGFAKV